MAGQLVTPIVVLIATTPRFNNLQSVAIPSIVAQKLRPVAVVIVSDQRALNAAEHILLQELLGDLPLVTLKNSFLPGAAGSWNTGINAIAQRFKHSYIAILDDDDSWQPDHLLLCYKSSDDGQADIVLSGINVTKNNNNIAVNIPTNITVNDFLVGNPGWQGSNTFVRVKALQAVGGFTNGMISSNDKDLAIRLLTENRFRVTYTRQATVNWACGLCDTALSAPGSVQKRKGCAQFLQSHGHRMSSLQMQQYFQRMEKLFNINQQDILTELQRLS
ncbi:glycosyltransferase family 2 protein [Rheinheimera sp. UJ63]|uniref:glycosyltransferase family 2 protein n=1 Tax=Rheinheimera sp. UJ63 TaxID=2910157 RepID=UPI001F2E0275|nr:glycosyltransferase family 2 protein [Rheinheimera sp. UJ63]MCF4009998.1 glycosyltransferase [Rheinheimera sp. UJ63]